jgi:pimeloyl-ACP methyl ester carboxylesterase
MWGNNSQWPLDEICGHQVIPIDLFNHSADPGEQKSLSHVGLKKYADKVIADLDDLTEPVYLIGHSLGALIANLVAYRAPGLVKGVVSLASVPFNGIRIPFQWRFLRYARPIVSGCEFRLTESDAEFVSGGLPVQFGPESGRVLWQIIWGVKIPTFRCPRLAIAGTRDQFYPVPLQQRLAQKLNSLFLTCNSTHMLHLDQDVSPWIFRQIHEWAVKQDERQ